MFTARIVVTLRPSILDPQGKAVAHAAQSLGHAPVQSVRIGKVAEVVIDTADEAEARALADTLGRTLLANPVMEDYAVEIVAA